METRGSEGRSALEAEREPWMATQHNVASVLAEHDCIDGRVIGVALDGTGYGTDGSIWGGEFFVGSATDGFERVLSFRPVQMPGGDAAARFPVQAAAGFLADLDEHLPELTKPPFDMPPRLRSAMGLVRNNVRCFRSTSAGRLFDAIAPILGFVAESTFEGQTAIWVEMQARRNLHVITNRIVPVNDGGLCLGQAAIACVGRLSLT